MLLLTHMKSRQLSAFSKSHVEAAMHELVVPTFRSRIPQSKRPSGEAEPCLFKRSPDWYELNSDPVKNHASTFVVYPSLITKDRGSFNIS